jgi:hypothetical protein
LRLVSCLLRDAVIYRFFGLGGEMETDDPEMKLSGAACLMETINDESQTDR